MTNLFVSPELFDSSDINLKLQKDMCQILLYKRQIEIIYEDESICVRYISHNTKVSILLKKLHPFITPFVTINNTKYNDWMIEHSKCAYPLLHRLKFASPCCNSLLNHWTPLIQINSLLIEIENNVEFVHILNGIYIVIENCMHETKNKKDYIWIASSLLQYLI